MCRLLFDNGKAACTLFSIDGAVFARPFAIGRGGIGFHFAAAPVDFITEQTRSGCRVAATLGIVFFTHVHPVAGSGFLGHKHQAFGFQRCEFVPFNRLDDLEYGLVAVFIPQQRLAGRQMQKRRL